MFLNYKILGSGEYFAILHGLFGMLDNWVSFANIMSPYFKVVLLDQRNHGKSDHTKTHSYDDLVNDFYNFCMEHKIRKTILLGHSMGGRAAMKFALEHSKMISKLIIVDVSPENLCISKTSNILKEQQTILQLMQKFPLCKINSYLEAKQYLSQYIENNEIIDFICKNISKINGHFQWKLNIETLSCYLVDIVADFKINTNYLTTPFPTLLIKGNKSSYVTDEGVQMAKRLFSQIEVVTIEAGHWVHAEQPEAFQTAIMHFTGIS